MPPKAALDMPIIPGMKPSQYGHIYDTLKGLLTYPIEDETKRKQIEDKLYELLLMYPQAENDAIQRSQEVNEFRRKNSPLLK